MLNEALLQQVKGLMPLLRREVVFAASLDDSSRSTQMREMLTQIAELSPKITFIEEANERTPSFAIRSPQTQIDIRFAGLPMGHEFASFMLAIVQVGGHPPKIDEEVRRAIENLDGDYHLTTYFSLSCQNCPEVVQSLNMMAVINPRIHHTAIEGGAFENEVTAKEIKSVPAVFRGEELFTSGRMGVNELLKLMSGSDSNPVAETWRNQEIFDVLVAGGGPAGVSSAVYAARKGLRVGIVAERVGGQVLDTAGIENLITLPHAEGPNLGQILRKNAIDNGVVIMEPLRVERLSSDENLHVLECSDEVTLKGRSLVIATGAEYRKLGVPGEEEYLTHGVTFCPHCDGPLFKGQKVAVIGGGNSGIEAAIDLAGIVEHVTVFEFLPECRADKVLLDALGRLSNAEVITNAAVQSIDGNGKEVTGLSYQDRVSGQTRQVELSGVFIQVGLLPRTAWLNESGVELNERGEIVCDRRGATTVHGVYAAGDCSDTTYKQIVTALGTGATAALSAYEHVAIGR
ncbi:alkyl hydroperoxide reductase subunit F [Actinomycetaceae bacterium TAE3-ERU4]|nr:alkyl hydroperoxide reductase subunit F [Actinomycetaceae bacterium TAE3-ERU4]